MDSLNIDRNSLRNTAAVFIALIVSCLCFADPVIPEPQTTTDTYTFKELGWDKSATLNGYKPGYTLYIPLAQYLNPQKAVLHLKLAFSSSLTEDTRLEIKFNQTLIRTVSVPADISQELNLDIELPLTQLSADWQALYFSANLSSMKSLCNPDNWIYISPQSSVTVTTLGLPFKGTLNQIDTLFINPISIKPKSLMLLLPKNPANQEIFSLLRIALQIGKMAVNNKVVLQSDFLNEPDAQKTDNLILVGTTEHLFKDTGLQLNTLTSNPDVNEALINHAGIILLSPSPFNPFRGLLTFTGIDYSSLNKAVSAFLTPEFTKLASGSEAIIDKVQVQDVINDIGDWYQTTLDNLGYSDQSVSGLGRHELSYTIALPNARTPTNATVKTLITAPPFKLKDHSQVTLLVNGLKQSSFRLTQPHSSWEAQIDSSAMKPGINKLEYLIDLHLEDEHCSRENYDEIWATIHAATEFNTQFLSKSPQAMLSQFPVPFSSEATIILPDQLSRTDINNLTQLVFKFGQLIQPQSLSFNFLTSSEANEEFIRNHDIILYGTVANNPWIKFASDYMPVQLEGNSRILISSQKKIQFGGERFTGLLELVHSPWCEDKNVLLISGDNQAALSQTVAKFIDDKSRIALDGNIALINADSSVELLKSDDTRYFSFKNQIKRYLITIGKNTLYYVQNNPQIFIYLIALLVPLYIFFRQRKK